MKTLKYLLIIIMSMGLFYSCVDNTISYVDNDKGLNVAGFRDVSVTISAIADGSEYVFDMPVKIVGPSKLDLTGDVTLTIAVDESSTAVNGTHYRIDNPTIVLTAANNYLGNIPITMTTAGIETPLAKAPVLVLKTVSATGDDKVTNNGKLLSISMNFACFTEFQGDYNVVVTNSAGGTRSYTDYITKTATETYLTHRVGTWSPALSTTYGFPFTNSCNELNIPLHDLADAYSNDVWSHKAGSADPVTGVLTFYYTIYFAAGNTTYTAVYTPVAK